MSIFGITLEAEIAFFRSLGAIGRCPIRRTLDRKEGDEFFPVPRAEWGVVCLVAAYHKVARAAARKGVDQERSAAWWAHAQRGEAVEAMLYSALRASQQAPDTAKVALLPDWEFALRQ